MTNNTFFISYSPNYCCGFTNVSVTIQQFFQLLNIGVRIFHKYNENAVRNSITALNYKGRSSCYQWLRALKYTNQFTGDLLSRKSLRSFLTFQYVFIDVLQMPYNNLNDMLHNMPLRPNIISVVANKTYRFFYLLEQPMPLTQYTYTYYNILCNFTCSDWLFTDVSTPKIIKGYKGKYIHDKPLNMAFDNALF